MSSGVFPHNRYNGPFDKRAIFFGRFFSRVSLPHSGSKDGGAEGLSPLFLAMSLWATPRDTPLFF